MKQHDLPAILIAIVLILVLIVVLMPVIGAIDIDRPPPNLDDLDPFGNVTIEEKSQEVILSSEHQAQLVVVHDSPTNNTTTWQSSFHPFRTIAIRLVGQGLPFSIQSPELLNLSGNTTEVYTRVNLTLGNWSSVSLIVKLDNVTYNFGSMNISLIPLNYSQFIRPPPPTITIADSDRQKWDLRIGVAISVLASCLLAFVLIKRFKQGRIKKR